MTCSRNAARLALSLSLAAALGCAAAGAERASEPASTAAAPSPPPGLVLAFSDEFDTPGRPDPAKWDDRRVAFTQRWSSEWECTPLERLDMATGVSTPLPPFGDCPQLPAVAGPLLASASPDGILVVRASRVSAREAHLFPGRFFPAWAAISPD